MAMLGMDPGAVRALAKQMDGAASDINNILSRISKQLGSTQWVGKDADQFRNEWNTTHVKSLRNAATSLINTATKARQEATQQEQASS